MKEMFIYAFYFLYMIAMPPKKPLSKKPALGPRVSEIRRRVANLPQNPMLVNLQRMKRK
jgi:hypothetical protein